MILVIGNTLKVIGTPLKDHFPDFSYNCGIIVLLRLYK